MVDIGSWTVDIMPIINHLPDESVCVTQPYGIITCIQQIYRGAERGSKAGNGCPCAKRSDTVVFLPGNFGCADDGNTQEA